MKLAAYPVLPQNKMEFGNNRADFIEPEYSKAKPTVNVNESCLLHFCIQMKAVTFTDTSWDGSNSQSRPLRSFHDQSLSGL